jgi:hypothetical protein
MAQAHERPVDEPCKPRTAPDEDNALTHAGAPFSGRSGAGRAVRPRFRSRELRAGAGRAAELGSSASNSWRQAPLGDTLVGMDHEMAVRIAAQRLRALDALRAARDANAAGYSVRTVASWAGVAHQVLSRSMRR